MCTRSDKCGSSAAEYTEAGVARAEQGLASSLAVMVNVESLERIVPCQRNVPLAGMTTWRVGGSAELFWEADPDRLPEVLACCHAAEIPVHFLGRGSNVLVADEGVPGLTIGSSRTLRGLKEDEGRLCAEAGVGLPDLARYAASLGWSGCEFVIGIPGTVGAGVVINAGVAGGEVREMAQIVDEIEVCDRRGNLSRIAGGAIRFSHRHTDLIERGDFVLRCWFKPGSLVSRDAIQARMQGLLDYRRATQPLTKRTAGSTFKRPPGGEPAAVYIDRAGLKGFRIGGARVSPKHANFIETEAHGSAQDVADLIVRVQKVIRDRFGIQLEPEIRCLGRDLP